MDVSEGELLLDLLPAPVTGIFIGVFTEDIKQGWMAERVLIRPETMRGGGPRGHDPSTFSQT